MSDPTARHILKRVWYELINEIPAAHPIAESATIVLSGDAIHIRDRRGTVVELTARTLSVDEPAAARIAESIRAIERGEVE